jgi:cyanophycinase
LEAFMPKCHRSQSWLIAWLVALTPGVLVAATARADDADATADAFSSPYLKDAVVRRNYEQKRDGPAMLDALRAKPGAVGYGLAAGATLDVRGRTARVGGDGPVTVVLSPSDSRPPWVNVVKTGGYIDLVAMNRAARARTQPAFPPAKMATPNVPHGTLVIIGGGLTSEIMARFIDAAGGKDHARIVVVPTALGPDALKLDHAKFFKRFGVEHIDIVHADDPKDADTDANLAALRTATGVWFTGGRQWHIVDGFEGTQAYELMHDVLKRGGAIGGSSAGATIQGEYLVRGNPLGNTDMMAEGYEKGFAFLPGVAIDQHVAQRKRFEDLRHVKKRFPQLTGIGIDENTAIVVRGSVMEVIGQGKVHLYLDPSGDWESYAAGDRFDFKTRKPVEAAEQAKR